MGADTEAGGQSSVARAARLHLPHFKNLFAVQNGATMRLALHVPTLCNAVVHIVGLRAKEEVVRPHARAIVAMVKD